MVIAKRADFFLFLFNGGRGIRTDQVDWSVDDVDLAALLASLGGGGGSGNFAFALTAVPANTFGSDGDVAIVRFTSLELRGYLKVSGIWVRQWTFHGGDTVLLTGGLSGIVADRNPGPDPITGQFVVGMAITGYANVDLSVDLNEVDPQIVNGVLTVTQLSEWRGNLNRQFGNFTSRTNPGAVGGGPLVMRSSALRYEWTDPAYVFFWLYGRATLEIESVTQNGIDIPVVQQLSGTIKLWRSVNTYSKAEVTAGPWTVVSRRAAGVPTTWNRYAVVTADPTPTAADFLSDVATASPTINIFIPNSGWEDGRGYLHFALPANQDTPTLAGLPGGSNLISDFTVRSTVNTVTLDVDSFRTLSSDSPVFQMSDRYSVFSWIVR